MSRIGAILGILAASTPTLSAAEPSAVTVGTVSGTNVTLRVIRDDVPATFAYWLGTAAEPKTLSREAFPHLEELTGEAVGKALCGLENPGYWRAFEDVNGLPKDSFKPTGTLGDKAYGYKWPACLYVERGDFSYVVKDRLASDVYLEATGSPGTRSTHAHFFAKSKIPDVGDIKPDQVLRYGFRTQPVTITPIGSMSAFTKALAAQGATAWVAKPEAIFAAPPIPPDTTDGEIITHATAEDAVVAAAASPPPECAGKTTTPFDLDRVIAAYRHGTSNEALEIPVVVVDNGFFGAKRSAGKVSFATLFDRRTFHVDVDKYGVERIGPVLSIGGDEVQPINWENKFAAGYTPDVDSGHGTHVVRLATGADAVNRTELFPAGGTASWLQVSIVAFSRGERKIPSHSATQFSDALVQLKLQPAAIVNMSLKFGPGVETLMTNVIRQRDGTLFVVAAGNDRRDLDEVATQVYPAALGKEPNVITVAAEDGAGQLTEFTNKSGDFVGLAAPGCNVVSTLDGETPAELSGTSQAAPIVTFAAALLARRGLPLEDVKRRLILSGDMITGVYLKAEGKVAAIPASSDVEVPVRSRARLNLSKALFFGQDYLVYRETDDGPQIHALGSLSNDRKGPTCGGKTRGFMNVLAFRRSPVDQSAWCYWKDDDLTPARVRTGPKDLLNFKVDYVIDAKGQPQPDSRSLSDLPLSRVDEFVMSNVNMNIYD